MQCPKCGEEMEAGNIRLGYGTHFYPDPKPGQYGLIPNQIFPMGRFNFGQLLLATSIIGFVCRKDKVMSFEYQEK